MTPPGQPRRAVGGRAGTRWDDRGAGTVLLLAVVLVALLAAAGVGAVATAHAARGRAQAAADLAALAGATELRHTYDAGQACARADQAAQRNGAVLRACDATGAGVVEVAVTVPHVLGGGAVAHARAGPRRA
ncbi:Rv3654c family TadE-like protein [Cellulomonas sp.]|uniref:Rv3654c family TadE-like protein n=1 Tax=Cellulomonas sp. TaxID=40001 RepID=UPI00258DE529|nr:Rv3654c family TadE-like protein [Cellulomonas sp.]MCR6689122.1 pilus assembly protein TadG-related protein [Cellulomonas sp.]